jgi:hypothetical protein
MAVPVAMIIASDTAQWKGVDGWDLASDAVRDRDIRFFLSFA